MAALSTTMTARSGPSSAFITITYGFRFLAIAKGLAAKDEVMLEGFNDVVAIEDMNCKSNWVVLTYQEGHKAHILADYLEMTAGLCGVYSRRTVRSMSKKS